MTIQKLIMDTDTLHHKNEIMKSLIAMIVFSILGALLIPISLHYQLERPWLYVNPSYYKNPDLSWITSVWASILGIHGTLAALSITFLGMLAGQASISSAKHFAPVCRLIILRKNKFLSFSTEAISGLIAGIFLLSIGSGVIQYVFSVSISIYFIITYIKIYFELYRYTERPERIEDLLISELRDLGGYITESSRTVNYLNESFSAVISDYSYLSVDFKTYPIESKVVHFKINTSDKNISPMGFYPDKLKILNDKVKKISKEESAKLRISIPFANYIQPVYGQIIHNESDDLKPDIIEDVKNALYESIKYSKPDVRFLAYKELEECLMKSICENLKYGDSESIKFGVNALILLAGSDGMNALLDKVGTMLLRQYKDEDFTTAALSLFFETLHHSMYSSSSNSNTLAAYKTMLDLPFYLFGKNKYLEYFRKLESLIHEPILYGEDRGACLKVYISQCISNLTSQNYSLFEVNTDFLTKKMEYFGASSNPFVIEDEDLLISATREFIALMLIRLGFLFETNDNVDNDEFKTLKSLILKWVNPMFLEGIFFTQELYNVLFKSPYYFSERTSIQKLRNQSEDEVYSLNSSREFGEAIIILFLIKNSEERESNLDFIFIQDYELFYEKTKITTLFIDEIIKSLSSPEFVKIVNFLENVQGEKQISIEYLNPRLEKIKESFEYLKDKISKIINKKIEESPLNKDLVNKYRLAVSQQLTKELSNILDVDKASSLVMHTNNPYNSLIVKREVIDPIDGVYYSQNTRNHARWALYHWLDGLFKSIDFDSVNIVDVNSMDDLNHGKFITIINKKLASRGIHRYRRGFSIYNENDTYKLPNPGLYYLDVCSELDVMINKDDMCNVAIDLINKDNEHDLIEKYNIKTANIFLMSEIMISINVMVTPKNGVTLRYLSNEKAEEIFNSEESARQELAKMKTTDVNQQVVE
ncbi:hypothetical protein ACS765_16635 [Yersinia enterocolitica]|uniref:hypothetical protein n=1 Tax=Yersinia enterocolitica TaxID=630 RepID=UPI003F42D9D8